MIDIDLIMESVEWNSLRGFGWQKSSVTYDEMYQIITRLRQAEKDAARYLWLRDCDIAQTEKLVENGHIVGFGALDAMIDEAMKCSK